MTKIFCDIADINLIKKFNKKKIVKGFTTNPSLMRKAGAINYISYTKKILKITNKPVSCEVFADNQKEMIDQGSKISKWGKNIFVKVPVLLVRIHAKNEEPMMDIFTNRSHANYIYNLLIDGTKKILYLREKLKMIK